MRYEVYAKRNGVFLGTYELADPADALEVMMKQAGTDRTQAAKALGVAVAELDGALEVKKEQR